MILISTNHVGREAVSYVVACCDYCKRELSARRFTGVHGATDFDKGYVLAEAEGNADRILVGRVSRLRCDQHSKKV